MRLAGIVKDSIVDGPGLRVAIFVQGCRHYCEGCHNLDTHDIDGGYEESIDNIIQEIDANPLIDGITISGGEPFLQAKSCSMLIQKIKKKHPDYTVWVYTGFTYDEIKEKDSIAWESLLDNIDILVDGRYIREQRSYSLLYRGSRNQRLIDVKKTEGLGSVVLYEPHDNVLDKFTVPESL